MTTNIDQAFVQWHLKRSYSNLERHFQIGDIILNASVASGLCVKETITRLRKLVDSCYVCCESYYGHAVIMCQQFTRQQREVLLDKYVPVEIALKLANKKFDKDSKRSNAISLIKKGKLKAPFTSIRGPVQTRRVMDDLDVDHADSGNNPDNVVIAKPTGNPDRDMEIAENVFASLASRFKTYIGVAGIEKAFNNAIKRISGGHYKFKVKIQ